MEKLDVTSFQKAIDRLSEVISVWNKNTSDFIVRDSMIQRFEYTYSLALKMTAKFINLQINEISYAMTFNEIIRKASQFGLIKSNLETWDKYRKYRNMTSHTYDEETAEKVISIIPEFKEEAEFLSAKLKEKTL